MDYFPTLLDMLGLEGAAPEDQALDGQSIVPALKGEPFEREAPVYVHFPHRTPRPGGQPSTSVRQGRWKLIRYYCRGPQQQDEYELYDLKTDIGERRDVSEERPEKTAALRTLVAAWLEETGALVPRCNPNYDPQAGGEE